MADSVVLNYLTCKKCMQIKPVTNFSSHLQTKTGYRAECKSCRSDYVRNYYEKSKNTKEIIRKCSVCKQELSIKLFSSYDKRCKPCKRIVNRKYYSKNRERLLEKLRNVDPSIKALRNKRTRNCILKKQEIRAGRSKTSICEVCGNGGRIHWDHDHKTGKFRGWLCTQCNTSIGMVKDRIDILHKLIAYLVKNGH